MQCEQQTGSGLFGALVVRSPRQNAELLILSLTM
jgi:hypothetical protein